MRRCWPFVLPVLSLALAVLVAGRGIVRADDDATTTSLYTPRAQAAVERGLRFLHRTQRADGSWASNAGKKINETYRPFPDAVDIPHVGITSLAILAFLAGGHLPQRGPYGRTLDRAIDYVLGQVQPSGFIAAHRTRMYSHAFATLALAEVYGVTRETRVRAKLQDAVEYTVRSQNVTGGWRYVPFTPDSDMSVTVCQVVALRAARNAGLKVPRRTIRRAVHYVINSANTGQNRWPVGSFTYQPQKQQFNRDSFALCAAGLTTLFQAGLYDDRTVGSYMERHGFEKNPIRIDQFVDYMNYTYRGISQRPEHYFFYYGSYYATQAMYQMGLRRPELWASWYRRVRDDLLGIRHLGTSPDGEEEVWWRSNVDTTHAYATATALLILQFPLDQLPIHQR